MFGGLECNAGLGMIRARELGPTALVTAEPNVLVLEVIDALVRQPNGLGAAGRMKIEAAGANSNHNADPAAVHVEDGVCGSHAFHRITVRGHGGFPSPETIPKEWTIRGLCQN